MSFFKKHSQQPEEIHFPQYWDKTNLNGKKHAGLFDTIEVKTDQHREYEQQFMNDLSRVPSFDNQIYHKPIPSKINPELMVNEKDWVLSLVRKKDHAIVVVESLGFGNDKGLSIRWFDFITKDKPNAPRSMFGVLTNFQALKNKEVEGLARYCPTNGGQPLLNIPSAMNKHEIFSKLHWNEDSDSWQCKEQDVKKMMKDIMHDFELADQGKLKFRFCGHTIPNCTSWATNKLKKAGIADAENHTLHNWFIIRASHNVGSKREHHL